VIDSDAILESLEPRLKELARRFPGDSPAR